MSNLETIEVLDAINQNLKAIQRQGEDIIIGFSGRPMAHVLSINPWQAEDTGY